MSIIRVSGGNSLQIQQGGLRLVTGPSLCPSPTDDFSSYSVGAFPQAGWTARDTTGTGVSEIVASSTSFPTQNVSISAANGATTVESHTYDAVSWMNGEVQCKIESDNPSTANVQAFLIAQFVDTSNYLQFRLRVDTATFSVLLYEIIGGGANLRGSFTPPGGYSANTIYTMNMIVNGTDARVRILDEDCELLPGSTVGVNNDFTYTITGGNTGPTGIGRISQATPAIYYDDFYTA